MLMSESFPHGYAVVVGVGADLPMTVPDATAIADLLRDPARCAQARRAVQRTRLQDGRPAGPGDRSPLAPAGACMS
jgi:hypothetical protein